MDFLIYLVNYRLETVDKCSLITTVTMACGKRAVIIRHANDNQASSMKLKFDDNFEVKR